ncbi:hypothetical protein ACFSUS_28840 [Spirosoma soli]|uniref:DUF3592 domain-containing protein n=1 Tax=Spirosoma soli TaxID=1770529 RepID=A0ABW5MC88_9BACT
MKITKQTGTILVCLVLAFFIFRTLYRGLLLDSCHRYSIARAISFSGGGGNAGLTLDYTFVYNNKKYEGGTLLDKGDFYRKGESYFLNRRYFVAFHCGDPSNSKIDLEKAVPDTIVVVPPDGWKELPLD